MDKVMVLRYTAFASGAGWSITAQCMLAVLGQTFEATATSATTTPIGGWKPLMVAACAAEAVALFPEYVTGVDEVIFPDLTVVNV